MSSLAHLSKKAGYRVGGSDRTCTELTRRLENSGITVNYSHSEDNAKGYDAKDERMGGTPNQMNIRSMYSDIDLDANSMETEFQAAFEDLLWFVRVHLANIGVGDFTNEDVTVVFNRDILVNETEAIDNFVKQGGRLSNETLVKQHPWVDDPEEELERIAWEDEKKAQEALAADPYRASFMATARKTQEPAAGDNTPGGGGVNE